MRIVVLLDHSIYAESAVAYAGEIAPRSGADLDLVHVVSRGDHLETGIVGYHPGGLAVFAAETIRDGEAQMAAAQEAGGALLAKAEASLLERGAGLVRTRVIEGELPEVVREVAAEATLVILGKRGEKADFARLHLGAYVEAIVRNSARPILLVPRAYRPLGSCLVGFDTGAGTRRVIEALAQPGLMPDRPVRLLHVGRQDEALLDAFDAATKRLADTGLTFSAGVVDGVPGRAIPELMVTDAYGLLAIGASNAPRLAKLIFGSLTDQLIRSTQTPVLLA